MFYRMEVANLLEHHQMGWNAEVIMLLELPCGLVYPSKAKFKM